jgi:hypothetical protein
MELAREISPEPTREKIDADSVFEGGPLTRVQSLLRLIKPGERRVTRRAALFGSLSWVPLALLVTEQGLRTGDGSIHSFFTDFASYTRLLVTVPVLILAENDFIPRLTLIARHFYDSGLVTKPDLPRYQAAVSSTRRLLNSPLGEIGAVAFAYLTLGALLQFLPSHIFPVWMRGGGSGRWSFSSAGWWQILVSAPILLVLVFSWLWRIALWTRFLLLMSRLKLRLLPVHPDSCGGLNFVAGSLKGFRLIGFAVGALAAGVLANRVVREQASPLGFKTAGIVLVIAVLTVAAGPLLVFLKQLRQAKRDGIFRYGTLAGQVGGEFEGKWLDAPRVVDQRALEATDFSATTDLFGVVANVYSMKEVPFGLRDLAYLAVATFVPFIPIALLLVPAKVVLQEIAKFLL